MNVSQDEVMTRAMSQRRENMLYEQGVSLAEISELAEKRLADHAKRNSDALEKLRNETTQHVNLIALKKDLHDRTITQQIASNAVELGCSEERIRMELAEVEAKSHNQVQSFQRDMETAVMTELQMIEDCCNQHCAALEHVQTKSLREFEEFYTLTLQRSVDEMNTLKQELEHVENKSLQVQEKAKLLQQENEGLLVPLAELETRKSILMVEQNVAHRRREAYSNYLHANKMLELKLTKLLSDIDAYDSGA